MESISHYRITGKLGAGGMGDVYRAEDTKLKRDVAIKVLPDEFAEDEARMKRFEREAQVLASLNHPNIAAIYGLEESLQPERSAERSGVAEREVVGVGPHDTKRCALVLELVEGPTLAERIAEGPLPIDEAVDIARQIAVGLEAAHDKSIIHRDLKPANVKLTREGTVKILDFGLAKALEGETADREDSNSPTLTRAATQAGVLLGTAAYMSPEQAKGKPVDRRGDVWAFGAVLFEMLTGKRLFSGETISETLASVIKDEPGLERLPAEIPRHIRHLLRRCLTKDPSERLQAIGEARIAIDHPTAEPVETVTSTRPAYGPWLAAMAGALVAGIIAWTLKPESPRPIVRSFAVAPDSAEFLLSSDFDIAISPDGSRIIYGVQSDGTNELVARDLDQMEVTSLAASAQPRGPFVSPNGDWVGYFDSVTALRKVSMLGGPPITICSLGNRSLSRGASWGADDTIVFATVGHGGLWAVPASGGEPEELTKPGSTEENHIWPQHLPDGDTVLFAIGQVVDGGEDDARIATLSLSTREVDVLGPGGHQPRYVSTGHVVYSRDNTLFAVPFDLRTLEMSGEPVPVLEGVDDPAVGRDGTLVYTEGDPARSQRTLAWIDRQGREEPLPLPPRHLDFPRLSPDGSRVAFVSLGDVWTHDLTRETATRLTYDETPDMYLVWSPDGLRLAFTSRRPRNLFWKLADGTGEDERLTESPTLQFPGAFTPDGTRLVYWQVTPDADDDLHVLSIETGESEPLLTTEFRERVPALSPDGRFLAYASNESGRFEVYVRPFPNVGDARWQVSSGGGDTPMFARDGTELYFYSEGQILALPIQPDSSFAYSAPEAVVEDVFQGGDGGGRYDVSPDGERFLVIQEPDIEPAVVLVTNWGEELKRLVPPGGSR